MTIRIGTRLNSRNRSRSCQPSRPGSGDVEDDQVGTLVVEAAQRVGPGPGRRPSDSRPGRSTARRASANSGSSSTIRTVSATVRLARGLGHRGCGRRRPRSSGSVNATRVPAGRRAGRRATARPPCASTRRRQMNSPRPVPGIRDSRTFQARWNGSVTSAPVRLRDADALVVDGRRPATRPSAVAPSTTGLPSGRVLERVADEVREDLADARDVDLERRQVVGRVDDEPVGAAGDREVAAQPRDERRERRRRPLEDQRVGLQVRDVEDLVDERGQARRSPRRCARRRRAAGRRRGRGGAASRRSRG